MKSKSPQVKALVNVLPVMRHLLLIFLVGLTAVSPVRAEVIDDLFADSRATARIDEIDNVRSGDAEDTPGPNLHSPYPNPFQVSVTIPFSLDQQRTVDIAVYDLLGQEVQTLVSGENFRAGTHEVRWDGETNTGEQAPPGIYLVRLRADDGVYGTRRVILVD